MLEVYRFKHDAGVDANSGRVYLSGGDNVYNVMQSVGLLNGLDYQTFRILFDIHTNCQVSNNC